MINIAHLKCFGHVLGGSAGLLTGLVVNLCRFLTFFGSGISDRFERTPLEKNFFGYCDFVCLVGVLFVVDFLFFLGVLGKDC